ncbi:MAG: YfiR family protein [bacterium]|nr:YfiR family protein [bacterium]
MKKIIPALLMLVILMPRLLCSVGDEYFQKAAFFSLFAKYTQWPDEIGIKDKTKPFVIGVFGKNPFGAILEKAYSQKENTIKDKKVEIRFISKLEEISNCHILFVSKYTNKDEVDTIIAFIKGKPIISIGEAKGYAARGLLFNFSKSKGALRVEINPLTLKESQLVVESELLDIGKLIKPKKVKE